MSKTNNKESIKDRVAKLIDVKSLVTLILTAVFSYLAIVKVVSGEQLIVIYTVIIGFYFGTQSNKKESDTTQDTQHEDSDSLT